MSEPWYEDPALIADVTSIMRKADEAFQTSGGSTRHYVREQLLPKLDKAGFQIVRKEKT